MIRLPAAVALLAVLAATLSARAGEALPQVPGPGRAPGVTFEETARAAETAWAEGRADDAARLARAGLELNPQWREGLWLLGLAHTSTGRFAEARDALLRLVSLEPDAGPAWALLGLDEYRLRDHDRALAHLWRGTSLGKFDDPALLRESLLHFALLLMKNGDFGAAAKPLARVASGKTDPDLFLPCGLLTLRMPRLPEEIPADERDLVATAGRAGCAALARRADEARQGFEDLKARYPGARGVHFAYGLFLRSEALPGALALLQEEVRLFADHAEAQAELAFEILERGDPRDALPPAREAVRLAPRQGASHLALGRALLARDDVDGSLTELEQAARLAPEDQGVWLALAQAYARAGRASDVERARARLLELDVRRGAGPD